MEESLAEKKSTSDDQGNYVDKIIKSNNESYVIPANDEEWDRLNKQHGALLVALGALYPAPDVVRAVLAPEEGKTKKVLDLGYGSGIWMLSIAQEFPQAEVFGLDIAPAPIKPENIPKNCTFEVGDINNSLARYKDQFDVVHVRLIGMGLRDFRQSKAEMEACLKPGGILLWMEPEWELYARDRYTHQVPASEEHPEGSWFVRIFAEMSGPLISSGKSDLATVTAELNKSFWMDPIMDPETCRAGSLYLPLGPWADDPDSLQDQRLKQIGKVMQGDMLSVVDALVSRLIGTGLPADTVREWTAKATGEIQNVTFPLWLRMIMAWGRRRAAPGDPAPLLPTLSSTKGGQEEIVPRYRHFYVYETSQEAISEMELRNDNKL